MASKQINSPWSIYSHYAALVILALITLAPIWIMVATGFKDDVLVQQKEPVWFFFMPTMDNYEYIMSSRGKFDRYLWNSVIVGTSATFLTLLFGGLCAYALARTDFRGRQLIANSTLLVRMVPPAVLAVPAFAMVIDFSLDNDLAVLTFFYTAINLPFAIWLLFGFYKQIPVGVGRGRDRGWGDALAGLLQSVVAADEIWLRGGGDLHFPHRLERVHSCVATDRPDIADVAGGGCGLHHRHRCRMGPDHGYGDAYSDPAAALHFLCSSSDHCGHDRRCRQGLRSLSDPGLNSQLDVTRPGHRLPVCQTFCAKKRQRDKR